MPKQNETSQGLPKGFKGVKDFEKYMSQENRWDRLPVEVIEQLQRQAGILRAEEVEEMTAEELAQVDAGIDAAIAAAEHAERNRLQLASLRAELERIQPKPWPGPEVEVKADRAAMENAELRRLLSEAGRELARMGQERDALAAAIRRAITDLTVMLDGGTDKLFLMLDIREIRDGLREALDNREETVHGPDPS